MTISSMRIVACVCAWLLGIVACGGEDPDGDPVHSEDLGPIADETAAFSLTTGDKVFGTRLVTTANLNLRTGPSTSYSVRAVMPEGETVRVVKATDADGWYNINWDGVVGWASGKYLDVSLTPSNARQEATGRALSAWGFSYHWAAGDWDPTSQSPGSCSGSCPDCSHSGTHGADCSGFLAKVWVVPSSNTPLTKASHPYSTEDFRYGDNYWEQISRSSTTEGDAMVYRNSDNSGGHVFYVYGGDPWGTIKAIECKGCSEGCKYNNRTASSSYVAIRRDGY